MGDAEEWLRKYAIDVTEYTVESVARACGAPWELGRRAAQVVLRPTFDPELVVTMVEEDDRTTVRIDSALCSLWVLHQRDRRPMSGPNLSWPAPVPWRTAAAFALEAPTAAKLWRLADAAKPIERRRITLDGMPLTIRVVRDGAERSFEAWSPTPDHPARPLLDELLAMRERVDDAALAAVMAEAASYLQ